MGAGISGSQLNSFSRAQTMGGISRLNNESKKVGQRTNKLQQVSSTGTLQQPHQTSHSSGVNNRDQLMSVA